MRFAWKAGQAFMNVKESDARLLLIVFNTYLWLTSQAATERMQDLGRPCIKEDRPNERIIVNNRSFLRSGETFIELGWPAWRVLKELKRVERKDRSARYCNEISRGTIVEGSKGFFTNQSYAHRHNAGATFRFCPPLGASLVVILPP